MTAARRYARCEHGFLRKLCLVESCPSYEGVRKARRYQLTVVRSNSANGRMERVLAKIGTEWAPFDYEGSDEERNRDSQVVARLHAQGKIERRKVPGKRREYRRAP